MTVDPAQLISSIEEELHAIGDQRIVDYIRLSLIEPVAEHRDWDYGEKGQQYVCWIVFRRNSCEIAFCGNGFGPKCPWGLLSSENSRPGTMGMDSGWFTTFMEAFFESAAATELPIWQVYKVGEDGVMESISDEGGWNDIWTEVYARRNGDTRHQYVCDNSVAIGCRK